MKFRLICREGELSGSMFELESEARIGRDAAGRLTIGNPAQLLARISQQGEVLMLLPSAGARVTLDGTAVVAEHPLERMHVLSVDGVDFVFRMAGPPLATTTTERRESVEDTVVDMCAFDAVPDLEAKPVPPSGGPTSMIPDADATVQIRIAEFELRVAVPDGAPQTFRLRQGDSIIGRGSDADIRLSDPEMWLSRKHARVRVLGDQVELTDLGARNGVFVGGERVNSAILEDGMSFLLGPHLQFTLVRG